MDQQRPVSGGLTVSEPGPGCMVVGELYGVGEEEPTSTIRCSVEIRA